jgi:hypothetical protein
MDLGVKDKNRGNPKKKRSCKNNAKNAEFRRDIRKEAIHKAAEMIQQKMNDNGLPLDRQLSAGMELWRTTTEGEEDHSFSQDFKQLRVELVRLGGDGSPCVLHVENAFSQEFLVEDEKHTNNTYYCQDTNSGGGSSSIGGFFRCKTCHAKTKEEGADSEKTVMCPLVRVGKHNSVCSVPALD